jgi:signal transduction histidine kinase
MFSPEVKEVLVKGSIAYRYVEFEIVDHGPGMKGSEIDSLLNPQGSATKFSQRMRTSGLGLSMAKRMIEFHDGYLWIRSDGTSGTTVVFRIPIEVSRDES